MYHSIIQSTVNIRSLDEAREIAFLCNTPEDDWSYRVVEIGNDDRGEVTVIKIIRFERKGMASRVAVGIESPRKFKVMRTEIIPQQPTPPPSYGQKVDER